MATLQKEIQDLCLKYEELAVEWLREAIRIPEDTIKTNPIAGQSNGEELRLKYLKAEIIKHKCVSKPEDVFVDGAGNLVWVVEDEDDKSTTKKVIYFDGHSDTVQPLPDKWKKIGGLDVFKGLLDPKAIDRTELKKNLGWVPKESEYGNCIWGRGSADQLAGVITQMMATKVCLELKSKGALKNAKIVSVATVQEEDNDGCGPLYYFKDQVIAKKKMPVPDLIVITEGTGDSARSGLGIYRAQRGRMQIEVEVRGVSCHGSMPHMGKNPLEWGSRIIVEATEQIQAGEGILNHEFLGKGTRTASWCHLDTPSDCAVPERFVFRFDRRMTVGETPDVCLKAVEALPSIQKAIEAGLKVTVSAPKYEGATYTGYKPMNDQIYLGWETPADHVAIKAAVDAYKQTIGEAMTAKDDEAMDGYIKKEPYVGRWIFSTDGVGVPLKSDSFQEEKSKNWIYLPSGYKYPPMLGLGAGTEQNTHRIGEVIHKVELKFACMFMARLVNRFAELSQ